MCMILISGITGSGGVIYLHIHTYIYVRMYIRTYRICILSLTSNI